ncbi:hypothetical protein CHS0354_039766 [Potamilus streckersoni]|uniref:Uncharacterized protein n=1 Tax=Potamilus streckersoni TaxID=2493646 RepID=A0AAE0S052_9BIVA|nr:hypothetical protein CHS0354_039766 [Potamilus streckersoni]
MGYSDTSLLCKIVFILLTMCFITDLIGFSIPYWYSKEFMFSKISGKDYAGLWDWCTGTGKSSCNKIEDNNRSDYFLYWLKAVRTFSVLSWILFLVALVFIIIFIFCKSDKKALYMVAVCLIFAGAVCALIAFAVYTVESTGIMKEYSAAFAMTISVFVMGLIIGILGVIDYIGVVGGK